MSENTNPLETVIERAMNDEDFRSRLLADPKGTIESDMGLAFPEGSELRVLENTPTVTHLVLPMAQEELDLETLDKVAGGWCYHVNWFRSPNPVGTRTTKPGGTLTKG